MIRRLINRRSMAMVGLTGLLTLGGATPAFAHNGVDHGTPPAPGAYGSMAQSVEANIHDLPIGPLTSAQWPSGPTEAQLIGSQHDLLGVKFGTLKSTAGGSYAGGGSYTAGNNWAESTLAEATIGFAPVLAIKLGVVSSKCYADASGLTGSSIVGGGSITVLGQKLEVPIALPPNTKIELPGILTVTFNQQIKNPDGSLTVTAFDIHAGPILQTALLSQHPLYLTLAQSTCDAVAPVAPVAPVGPVGPVPVPVPVPVGPVGPVGPVVPVPSPVVPSPSAPSYAGSVPA